MPPAARRAWEAECSYVNILVEIAADLVLLGGLGPCHALELAVSRLARGRNLKHQYICGLGGRCCLKANAQSGCFILAGIRI
jgi:hypothetical protein